VSASRGILIGASGGSVLFDAREDGTLTGRSFYAVSSSSSATIYVLQVRREHAPLGTGI